jgi:hypothetical protein
MGALRPTQPLALAFNLGGGHAQLPPFRSIGRADRGRPNLPQEELARAEPALESPNSPWTVPIWVCYSAGRFTFERKGGVCPSAH